MTKARFPLALCSGYGLCMVKHAAFNRTENSPYPLTGALCRFKLAAYTDNHAQQQEWML
jgi:hypothetical protein